MRLEVFTFAGRKRYMEILFPKLKKYRNHITFYRIFVATQNKEDIEYIEDFYESNKDWVGLVYHPSDKPFNKAYLWDIAYQYGKDEDTIYLKIDDDIVYLEESLFTDFIQFRKEHPEYLLVYPMIINNVIGSSYLQQNGLLKHPKQATLYSTWKSTYQRIKQIIINSRDKTISIGKIVADPEILCPNAWGDIDYCKNSHTTFIKDVINKDLDKYRKGVIVLEDRQPMSIQVISWHGKTMKEIQNKYGNVYADEPWLSIFAPTWCNMYNCIYSNSIVSHFSYYKQEEQGIHQCGLLEEYHKINRETL
jgi:hypothetical protein